MISPAPSIPLAISFWVLLMGIGMPFFFLPLTSTALGSVAPDEIAAAGLQNFVHTLAGAFGTSIVNTVWENGVTRNHAELAGVLNDTTNMVNSLVQSDVSDGQAVGSVAQIVNDQAVTLSTNHVFMGCALAFALAACAIWLSPRAQHVDTAGVH